MKRKQADALGYTMHRLGDRTIMTGPSGREQPYRSEREALDSLEMAVLQSEHADSAITELVENGHSRR